MTRFTISLLACITGFVFDFIFGDPARIYHPVRIMGKGISAGENILRRIFHGRHLTAAGAVLWICTAGVSFAVPTVFLMYAWKIHPAVYFVLESFWCFQIFAARSLCTESGKVRRCLLENDLDGARKAVSMIVGRDTDCLTAEGVAKAAVETVAENTSDGVTAPLIYMIIGGAPLGFLYKAVNTMDSMLGYKNDRYLYFGRVPAVMDDIFNFIPSRITAAAMIAAAYLTGMNGENAFRIYIRDRKKHASPNSAQTEAVCAGALGVQLAGDAYYFGKLYKKEFIGDSLRPIRPQDIKKAEILMYTTAVIVLILAAGIKGVLIFMR